MGMDISTGGYKNSYDTPKATINGIAVKPQTLEDIRDTTNKSYEIADLEKLMEKYDPEAYAEYSKIPESVNQYSRARANYLSKWMDKIKKGLNDGTISSDGFNVASKSNESQLSVKAQEFLKNLRKQYGDYDFFVGNSTDNLSALVKSGTKEFSIIFSNEELEKMANDVDYAKEKLQSMEQAVKMSKEISKQFGHGKDGAEVSKIGIVFNDDGTTSFFAELEKSSAKQREWIEKSIEDKRTARKEEKGLGSYSKSSPDTKRASIQANSIDELLKKIRGIDWNAVKAEKVPESGGKYDFSI